MVILFVKTLRDMMRNKKAYAACILLIAVAIVTYISMSVSIDRLKISKEDYYRDYNIADAYASVSSIPYSARESLLETEGIKDVDLRIVYEARVIIEGNEKIITMRLISAPDEESENPVNRLFYEGNDFYSETDIMVDKDFCEIHNKSIGDKISLIINGQEKEFTICAVANSPEYVYIIKSALEIIPDAEVFSIGYLPSDSLNNLLVRENSYNDICFTFEEGYEFEDLEILLEDALSKYGLKELYKKEDQLSYSMVEAEIQGNESMTTSIPAVFIFMAVVILYLMLKRVIEQDRAQIGTMKAFGYSSAAVVFHYMTYGIITGLLGGVVGSVSGVFAAEAFTGIYMEFFKLPDMSGGPVYNYVIASILISMVFGAIGAFMGAKGIIKLQPADAMRAKAPKTVTTDYAAKIPFLKFILNSRGNMTIRSIMRSKLRSSFVIMGIMFSFGMLAFMGSYGDMMESILFNQYRKIQLFDMKINFKIPMGQNSALSHIFSIDGVALAEPMFEVPVEAKNAHLKEGLVIQGIENDSSLYKIYDNKKKTFLLPDENGIIISDNLAADLDVQKGDTVYISSSFLKEDDVPVLVCDIITMNLGSAAFMEIDALRRLLDMPDLATSVIIKTDDPIGFKEYAKSGKNIAFLEDTQMTLKGYEDFLAPYSVIIYAMEILAVMVAVAIIYNISTISLSERQREYATLRVIGLQTSEIAEIMAFEFWILCFFGILAGVPFTWFLREAVAAMIDVDMFSMPTNTPISAYVISLIGCIAAVKISNISAHKGIKKLDMVEVLKERE